ncbi:MAG: pentapeptide repeat-containing protein, partial [Candidatus Entotheonellia bacterium]
VGLYFTWENLKTTQKTATETQKTAAKNLELTHRGQITEGFTKAIAQLGEEGPEKMTLRIGGIYALERIAKDSEEDHWPIMEILTSYVRKETRLSWKYAQVRETPAPAKGICPRKYVRKETRMSQKDVQVLKTLALAQKDVQVRETPAPAKDNRPRKFDADIDAVLTVLKRRNWERENEEQHLNLQSIDLSDVSLQEARLENAYLQGAYLKNASLVKAHLQRANLYGADLRHANLSGADLKEAKLWRADLRGADFSGAELEGANLREAHLDGPQYLTDKQRATVKNLDQAHIDASPIAAGSTKDHIPHPQDGTEVGEQITVHGSIHGLPRDRPLYLWLAVKKGDLIWPKYPDIPVPVTGSSWTVTVYEGETPPGQEFELVLYRVGEEGHKEIRKWLYLGYTTTAFPGLRKIADSSKLGAIQLCMR